MGESRNSHMLVLKSRPLRRDAWKPKQWIRLVPRGLFVPFYLWGHQSTGLSAGRCSDGLRLPLFVLGSHNYWDGLRDFGGYPTSRVVAIGMGTYNSLGEGKYSPQVWLQGPEPVGCVGQSCLDSCLKTQTRLMFWVIGMAGLIYRP